MLKILDRFVLKSFLAPFVATFIVALFILIMQFVWKYIDDFAGKGIEWGIIAEFMLYLTAGMVPLALPLGIMLASIMLFGNLAERYELAAIKASGVSIQRVMAPLILFTFLVSLSAFLYSNYLLPYVNLKSYTLLYDITEQKPAVNLKEGIFYNGIENISIRVGKKSKKTSDLYDVLIYDHTDHRGTNKVVYAQSGLMNINDNGRTLLLTLRNGYSYEEVFQDGKPQSAQPFLRSKFAVQEIRMDLSAFKLQRSDEALFKDNYSMLNLKQLGIEADSAVFEKVRNRANIQEQIDKAISYDHDTLIDKQWVTNAVDINWFSKRNKIDKTRILENALNIARNNKSYLDYLKQADETTEFRIRKYNIEWHKKITLSLSCFILFFIGAPLGAIIKKGGLGMPLVVSVLFFVVFHVLSVTGEKMTKEGSLDAFQGMWLATAVLLPIGIFLTYKATTDSVLFDAENYTKAIRKLLNFKRK